jgi:hypothetical protein
VWWITLVIPATWEMEIRGWRFKGNLGKKKFARPYIKEQTKHVGSHL